MTIVFIVYCVVFGSAFCLIVLGCVDLYRRLTGERRAHRGTARGAAHLDGSPTRPLPPPIFDREMHGL